MGKPLQRAELASNKVREPLRDLLRFGDEIAVAVASWSISFDWFTERLVTTESVLTAQVGQPRQSRAFPLSLVGTGLVHASKVFGSSFSCLRLSMGEHTRGIICCPKCGSYVSLLLVVR